MVDVDASSKEKKFWGYIPCPAKRRQTLGLCDMFNTTLDPVQYLASFLTKPEVLFNGRVYGFVLVIRPVGQVVSFNVGPFILHFDATDWRCLQHYDKYPDIFVSQINLSVYLMALVTHVNALAAD